MRPIFPQVALCAVLVFISARMCAQTSFPPECNDELQFRSAWPKHPDTLRFWVKGSANYRDITVQDATGRALVAPFRVESPYYTHVFEYPRVLGEMVITATGSGAPLVERLELTGDLQSMPKRGEEFSILAYGCLEPFDVKKRRPDSFVEFDNNMPGSNMLVALRAISNGESLQGQFVKPEDTGIWSPCEFTRAPQLPPPAAVITTGDQVYVDAGYETKPCKFKDRRHPVSAWQVKKQPMPLPHMRDTTAYHAHLDAMYRSFSGFEPLQDVLERLPQAHVWDDHEIRDGWGSQLDEYFADGRMNPELAGHFNAAKKAFIAHQSSYGPAYDAVDDARSRLYRSFNIGPVQCFAFDLRSYRDADRRTVIGDEQWRAFHTWR